MAELLLVVLADYVLEHSTLLGLFLLYAVLYGDFWLFLYHLTRYMSCMLNALS